MSAPHDKLYPNRTPDPLEQDAIDKGYKFLGWQVHGEPLADCIAKGHNDSRNADHWRERQNNPRGSNVTFVCDNHRIFWKIDMSD